MTTTDQVLLTIETMPATRTEADKKPMRESIPRLILPTSFEIPDGSLLLGQSIDGQPVLLNLYDSQPGPILVTGDAAGGKTRFLQSLARMSDMQDPGDITFGVVTPFPEEWKILEAQSNCLGIWPVYHPSAMRFLSLLAGWSEWMPKTRQVVILFLDGLDLVMGGGFQSLRALRKLVRRGPQRQVWPIISSNAGRLGHLRSWVGYFHTCILGQVKNPRSAPLLAGWDSTEQASHLDSGQYLINNAQNWVKFHLPPQENGDLV